MKSYNLISWSSGLSILVFFPIILFSSQDSFRTANFSPGKSSSLNHRLSGEPMPPGSGLVADSMDTYCNVYVAVSLETGLPAADASAFLTREDSLYQEYYGQDSVVVVLDSVMQGHYRVGAYHPGYDTGYLESVAIYNDTMIQIQLGLKKYRVFDLTVDSVSLKASWSLPSIIAVNEDFEGELFPPAGWQVSTEGVRTWHRTLDGSTGEYTIPPGDNYYACEIDQGKRVLYGSTARSDNDGCCDYLITPPLDLTQSNDYVLDFYSFYEAGYGELAFIEYSFDKGETWEVLHSLEPQNIWVNLQVSLTTLCGQNSVNPVWLAFHADDAGGWGTGWAVDNVKIHVPSSTIEFTDFNVYLDDSLKSVTPDNWYNYAPLNYGQHYVASVSVNYPYGTSKKDYYGFTSRYLPPPSDLTAIAEESIVLLQWSLPVTAQLVDKHQLRSPENLLGYNIYKDDVFIAYQAHSGDDSQVYSDTNFYPGHYNYKVTGIYDLEAYGFPGDTGESTSSGIAGVVVDFCRLLPFSEHWDSTFFDPDHWKVDGFGWNFDEENGQEAPCVLFSPDSTLENYTSALISYPFCANTQMEGELWLDFDISLLSERRSGEDSLLLQVWNWESNAWTTFREFSTLSGSFEWTSEHNDVSFASLDNIFMIRFLAVGSNTSGTLQWRIDNISLYLSCPGPHRMNVIWFPDLPAVMVEWNPVNLNLTNVPAIETNGDIGRSLSGYNVYWGPGFDDFSIIGFTTDTTFYHNDPPAGINCYKVTAVWAEDSAMCESQMPGETCILNDVGMAENENFTGKITLYPNPAKDYVIIETANELKSLTLINSNGQEMSQELAHGHQYNLSICPYPPGLYLVFVTTDQGIITRKLTIQR